jgi:ribosomal protein S18 acetylase RimI-like enzyme
MATIRPAEAGEAAVLAALHVTTWQEAYAGLLPEAYLASLTAPDRLPLWERLLAARDGAVIRVAEAGGTPVGFCCAGSSSDDDGGATTAELGMLYLLRAYWGKGIGRDLHDAVLAELAARGFGEATLWVMESNARTRRWYERQGWSFDGRRRDAEVWGVTITEVRYRTTLHAR